jgi:hypothetical protein
MYQRREEEEKCMVAQRNAEGVWGRAARSPGPASACQTKFVVADDLDPDGRIQTSSLQRLLVKALKTVTTIKAHPDREDVLTPHLKLLRTPKSAKAALDSPQWREWRATIDKELASLVDKGVYEVRKIPPGTKAIPTKLVLRIKLNSDGTVDKYKVRCVALGFLQHDGLHYHPNECYSPMSDPSTTRTLVTVSNALNLNINHLDVSVAYLNSVLPADQLLLLSPSSRLRRVFWLRLVYAERFVWYAPGGRIVG